MNLFKLSWSNLKAEKLSTFLSLMLLTLGVGIISMLLLLNAQLDENFKRNIKNIDMVVGAKGSPLQLILSAVYHIDNPTGNISMKEAETLAKHPLIKKTIPLAYGDNYKGYRILGTDTSYVSHYQAAVAEGRLWEKTLEATVGAVAAERLGLKMGDTFFGAHGLSADSEDIHDDKAYTVVGILARSNTVLDQLILTEVSSLWAVHEKEEDSQAPADTTEADEEITAMLVKFRSPMGMVMLPRIVNQETNMQAAMPAFEVNRLYDLMGTGRVLLEAVAIAIIIISGISVFISLYNSLKKRKYELALMRTMGASGGTLFGLIILEGLILAFIGAILGLVVSRIGMWILSSILESNYHYQFDAFIFLPLEGALFGAALLLGFLAAVIPALRALGTDIHETLAGG